MYQAVADGEVDVISAFTSDGRIAADDLLVLGRSGRRGLALRRHPAARGAIGGR